MRSFLTCPADGSTERHGAAHGWTPESVRRSHEAEEGFSPNVSRC